MSDLDRFELFIHVATTENLTEAANLLGVAKSSLSKQIANLEAELKVDLFTRDGQRLRLTEHGKALLDNCIPLKAELENVRTFCQQLHAEPQGSLKIATFGSYYAEEFIFPKLNEFLQLYPKLQLIINTNEQIPDFTHDKTDLAIGLTYPMPPDIIRRKMMATDFILCAAPSYLQQYGTPQTLTDLQNHRYISHIGRPEIYSLRLTSGQKLNIKPALLLSSAQDMISCAERGLGIIQLAEQKLTAALAKKTLIPILHDYYARDVELYYYYPKYRYVRPALRKFIDFFFNKF